ncbi:MAG TPA: hypothetical protein VFV25_05005 [Methylibium sp.]
MKRVLTLSCVAAALAFSGIAMAQTSDSSSQQQAAPAKHKAAKKSQSRKEAQPKANNQVTEPISDGQLAVANRVLTGKAQCEFGQTVEISPLESKKGAFVVSYKKASYVMVPEETTTGAVRLEDKKNGIVWLQIANKSMMMNQKLGQRMVDDCMLGEQRAAVDAMKAAAQSANK